MPLEEIKGPNNKSYNTEKLEVTIIPVDDEAYSKTITIPQASLVGK